MGFNSGFKGLTVSLPTATRTDGELRDAGLSWAEFGNCTHHEVLQPEFFSSLPLWSSRCPHQ